MRWISKEVVPEYRPREAHAFKGACTGVIGLACMVMVGLAIYRDKFAPMVVFGSLGLLALRLCEAHLRQFQEARRA